MIKYYIVYNFELNCNNGDYLYDQKDKIEEFKWQNLEIAKENLQRIKEHYEFNKNYFKIQNLDEFKLKDWFVNKVFSRQNNLYLLNDKNENIEIIAKWCDSDIYLKSMEIIACNNDWIIKFNE